jgi:hypothetical protein
MADAKLVARANEVIDRLFALNEAMESADAFCAYLKELNARDVLVKQYLVKPSDVGARHVLSIRWVHAGILRAAIGTITACLDLRTRDVATEQALDRLFNCSRTRRSLT